MNDVIIFRKYFFYCCFWGRGAEIYRDTDNVTATFFVNTEHQVERVQLLFIIWNLWLMACSECKGKSMWRCSTSNKSNKTQSICTFTQTRSRMMKEHSSFIWDFIIWTFKREERTPYHLKMNQDLDLIISYYTLFQSSCVLLRSQHSDCKNFTF